MRRPAPSAGLTPLTEQACSQEPTLRSIDGSVPTSVQFVDVSSQPVRVYWLNYKGQRVLYHELAAGAQYVQQTYVTHPWVVTDQNGLCLVIYLPVSGPAEAVIRSRE